MRTNKKKKKIDHQGLKDYSPNPGGASTSTSTSTHGAGPDRISELPKEILHHILGFLEMDKFLIGTSLVSTKWRNLWKSVSILKFPVCYSIKHKNFVDHVLRLRDSQASKIQIFNCYWSPSLRGYDNLEHLHNFIVSAVVNQGAQEIQIDGHSRQRGDGNDVILHFNPSIFTSGELRKFTFKVMNAHYLIQFPGSMCCATQLTHLTLYDIRLPEGDGNGDDELHLVCPVLETLVLHYCYSKHLNLLDISTPRLKYLTICNTGMRNEHFDGLGGCRLEIHTPNLTSFEYSGCVFVDCFTENLPCITRAQLRFSKETDMVEKTNSFAIKLLKVLTSASFLSLAGFEVFSQDTLSAQLTTFTSLTHLSLITSCNISSIHGMVHILNNCNSVEVLSWFVDKISSTVEGDDEHLMLPQRRLSHLELVFIEDLRGHENEIEFVKFLLKSSIVLKQIIINTDTDSPKITTEEKLKQFIEEEPSFRSIKLQIL